MKKYRCQCRAVLLQAEVEFTVVLECDKMPSIDKVLETVIEKNTCGESILGSDDWLTLSDVMFQAGLIISFWADIMEIDE